MASTQPCGQYVSLQTTDITAWTWFSSSTELLRCREQRSLRKTLAYVQAGNTVGSPNRASASGCLGTRSSGTHDVLGEHSKVAEGFPKIDRHRGPLLARPAAVSLSERRRRSHRPLQHRHLHTLFPER